MTAIPQDTTPAGYMRNARGHLVPVETISELDMMRDALVQELISNARSVAAQLAAFKRKTFADVYAFAAVSAHKYGTAWGGKKGNITLTSYDGSLQVRVATSENITFDERLQVAKALIDECLNEWSEEGRPEIKTVVQETFRTDKEGQVNVGMILGLRRYDIADQRWKRAMESISDSLMVTGTKQYVRFYQRVAGTAEYQAISLDVAAA